MYGYVWLVWVCMGMYGYLDVTFLVPYFSIVVDVGIYIKGGPTTTKGMHGSVLVCMVMYGYVLVYKGILVYIWVWVYIYGYV